MLINLKSLIILILSLFSQVPPLVFASITGWRDSMAQLPNQHSLYKKMCILCSANYAIISDVTK